MRFFLPDRTRRRRRASRPTPARRARLVLESLEIREVPALIAWINPLGGNWDNPINWLGGVLPGANDIAVIGTIIPAQTYTVSHYVPVADSVGMIVSNQNLNISAGSVAIGPSSTINSLKLGGGTLSGPGDLTLSGLFSWTGGALNGGLTLNAQGGISISGAGSKTLDGSTINNSGSATWSSGNIGTVGGGTFNNLSGATFTDKTNGTFHTTFNNAGAFTMTGGGVANIDTLNNSGALTLQNGTLNLGVFSQSGGTTDLGGQTLTVKNMAWSGGVIQNGQVDAVNSLLLAGTTAMSLDNAVLNNNGTAGWTSGSIGTTGNSTFNNLTGATFTVSSNGTFNTTFNNASTFALSGGAVAGIDTLNNNGTVALQSGTLNVTSYSQPSGVTDLGGNTLNLVNMDWSGGAIQGGGQLNATTSLTIHGSASKTLDSTIDNSGTATWTAGNIGTVSGGAFDNLSSATFTDQTNGTSNTTFNNAGAFTMNGGGVTNIDTLNNSGTVTLQNGTLILGTFTQSGGTTDLRGQTLTANNVAWSGGVIQNGQVDAVNSLLLDGTAAMSLDNAVLNNSGTAAWTSGSIGTTGNSTFNNLTGATFTASSNATFNTTFNNGGKFDLAGSGVTGINTMINSSTVALQSGTLNVGTYTQTGGVTALGGNTFNGGVVNWSGGVIQGGGQLNAGTSLLITGTAPKSLNAAAINNSGTTTWTGGNVDSSGGATFNNEAGATFSAQSSAAFHATFNNAGLLTVNSSAPPAIDTVNNSGIVLFAGAGLNTGLYVQTAGETHLGGHNLNASNPVQLLGGGLFDGGTINADLINGGQIQLGGMSCLDVNGNYTQLPSGTLSVGISGPSPGQFNQLETSGTAYLGGNLTVTFLNGFTSRPQDSFPLVSAGAIPTPFGSLTLINTGSIPLEMIYSAHLAALAPVPPPLPTVTGTVATSAVGTGLGYLFPSSMFASAAAPTAQAADDLFRTLALSRLGGDASGESGSAEAAARFDRSALITSSLHGADDLSMVESGADDDLVAALLAAAGALDSSTDNDVFSGFDFGSRLLTGYQPKADIVAHKGSRAGSVATLTSDEAGEISTARTDGGADDDLPLEHFLIDPVRKERPSKPVPAAVSQSSSSN